MNALYIHIPFCNNICSYCDFYKMIAKDDLKIKYIEYLIKEINLKKNYFKDIQTIYVGGGSPSALNPNLLDYLFYHLGKYIDYKKLHEFTIEVNPKDVTLDLIKIFKRYNVNRISMGVQSFDKTKLKFLRRNHSNIDVKRAFKLLHQNDIDNINIDLIYGTPNDSFKTIKKDLKIGIKLGARHFSTYSLILEDKTILGHLFKQNKFELLDDDKEYVIYHKIQKYLKRKTFIQYEVSNFAYRNFESEHNLIYWSNLKYLGIGAGASYYIDNIRYTNIMNLNKYFEGIDLKTLNYQEVISLTKQDIMKEEMILGFRKTKGINIIDFKTKYSIDIFIAFPVLKELINKKMLVLNKEYITIPFNKLFLSNEILVNFV